MSSHDAKGASPAPDQGLPLPAPHQADTTVKSGTKDSAGAAQARGNRQEPVPACLPLTREAAAAQECGSNENDAGGVETTLHMHFDHALSRMKAGDQAGAIAAFRRTLALAPWLVEAHINLGLLLSDAPAVELGAASLAEAEAHYRAALAIAPARLEAYLHLGVLLAAQKHFGEAESLYRTALAIDANCVAALSNLGVLLACTGREQQATACYRAALAIDPAYQNAHFNLAYLLLRRGQFAPGWQALEHRPWYARFDACFRFPRWDGQSLQGKKLLIGIEAGNGDMIQFCRYAELAKQAGATRVGIVCHPGLRRLLRNMPSIDSVFGIDEALPEAGWDYWTPPLSMPYHFGTRIDTIPAPLPYLAADPDLCAAMAMRLGWQKASDGPESTGPSPGSRSRLDPLRIGLVWQGNPRFENDAERSLPSLDVLAPLSEVGKMCFFSLQKGPGELSAIVDGGAPAAHEEGGRPAASLQPVAPAVSRFGDIVDLAPYISDFADTAAFITQLDLVITVDTAVAHLAGALGKPCWVLLPAFKADWRWLTDRDDSPWYPGVMRLFRQAEAGDWSDVITRIRDALMTLAP